jgi:uracil-DNA glycosylase
MVRELVRTRARMVKANPEPERVGIAAPFLPWVGDAILRDEPGIYFIGIATRGCAGEVDNFEQRQKWSAEVASSPPLTPYWRYISEIAESVYKREYPQCKSGIAWSNQFKIGIFNKPPRPASRNPSGIYAHMQEELCRLILERELQLASTSVVIFLGDGPLIYRVVGKDGWDKNRHRSLGIWVKQRENGAPIIYQYHPGWLWRQGVEHFSEHVQVVARAVREYLGKRCNGTR